MSQPGIVSVSARTKTATANAGDEDMHRMLDAAINMLAHTEETSIRLVVGKHTIIATDHDDEQSAVAIITGHAIAKSLRRMIGRVHRNTPPPTDAAILQPKSEAA